MKLSNFKPILFILFLNFSSMCFSQVHGNNENPMLVYLFNKYGVEESESILMKIKRYEALYEVFVFERSEYLTKINLLEQRISATNDHDLINALKLKKSKIICFQDIESTIYLLK